MAAVEPSDPSDKDDRYLVQPVLKAIQVLKLVCEAPEPPTLNQLVRRAALPKTTVFRYLRTLATLGLIEHDAETDRYRPGLGLWMLSQAGNPYEALRQAARPAMRRLRERFNETINLGVLTGGEVLYLDVLQSDRSLRMQSAVGATDSLHSTALGKTFLAFRPQRELTTLVPDELVAKTRNTIVDRERLLEQLATIRTIGYAIEVGENEEGSFCVAAPILDARGAAIAALSLSAPVSRLDETLRQTICASVMNACADITRTLRDESAANDEAVARAVA